MSDSPLPQKTSVLGIQVSRTTYEEATRHVIQAARARQPLIVSALAVHGLMDGVLYPAFGEKLNAFDMLTPDGQPIRWALNLFGTPPLRQRVYGPTLMLRICEKAWQERIGIYLFGSTEENIKGVLYKLERLYPGLVVSGWQADRFRDATPEEDAADIKRIAASGAGVVFCGRGCPRQEVWCHEHRNKLHAALIAVGAAFDIHAGTRRQAPALMQKVGLEWLFRFAQEPRRLWRRYLILNPLFVIYVTLQSCGFKRFNRLALERPR